MTNDLHGSDGSGIRLRGSHVLRTENFVDAAFAFAITLLVIGSAGVPTSMDALRAAVLRIPNFAVCMALLAVFWNAHHRFSRRFGLDDSVTRHLSWLLVFCVLIYVYPLRVVMSLSLQYFTGGLLPAEFKLDKQSDLEVAFAIYAVGVIALSSIMLALNAHALALRHSLALTDREVFEVRVDMARSLGATLISFASLAAACFLLVVPIDNRGAIWGLPGFIYALFALVLPTINAIARRRRVERVRREVRDPGTNSMKAKVQSR